jgi:hypothetical protein
MTVDLQASIVLITSSDRNNSRFGSGFVVRRSGGTAFILTCAHVIKDIGGAEQVIVDGVPATVIASGEDSSLDLAVVRAEGLWDKPPLSWRIAGEKGSPFLTAGFQLFGKDHLIRPLRGALGEQGGLQSVQFNERVQVWDLRILDDYTLQPGYSGSPVVDAASGDVIGVVSHRQGEGRSGLAISLAALAKIWTFVDSQHLYEELWGLGYRQQARLFRRLVDSTSVGAFLVYGPSSEYGQRWLINRLVQQFIPGCLTTGKVVRIELSRIGRKSDVNALWRELAGRVGLVGKPALPLDITERICKCWQTQHVFMVLHDVDCIPVSVLEELIHNFWLPLAQRAREVQSQANKFKLLLFLVDYEGRTESQGKTFVERLDSSWEPHIPVRSPRITEFSDDDLISWIEDRFDKLPSDLTHNVEQTVQVILENSDNGIPIRTLQEICYRCGCDWYEELETCLKL